MHFFSWQCAYERWDAGRRREQGHGRHGDRHQGQYYQRRYLLEGRHGQGRVKCGILNFLAWFFFIQLLQARKRQHCMKKMHKYSFIKNCTKKSYETKYEGRILTKKLNPSSHRGRGCPHRIIFSSSCIHYFHVIQK